MIRFRNLMALGVIAIGHATPAAAQASCFSIKDADTRHQCLAETRRDVAQCASINDNDRRRLCEARLRANR